MRQVSDPEAGVIAEQLPELLMIARTVALCQGCHPF